MTTTLADVPTFDFTLAGQWWSLPSEVAAAPTLARAFLKAALHVADSTGSATGEQELDPAGGAVLRRSYRTEFDTDVVEGVDTNRGEERAIMYPFRTHYWMTSPVPGRFALFSFSSQFVDLETELVDLFDAIVSIVRWRPFPSTNGEPQ